MNKYNNKNYSKKYLWLKNFFIGMFFLHRIFYFIYIYKYMCIIIYIIIIIFIYILLLLLLNYIIYNYI